MRLNQFSSPRNATLFRKQGSILKVQITGTLRGGLLKKIGNYLSKVGQNEAKKPLFITTPNSEQAVLASRDEKFREILQNSDISLCDGVGLLAGYEYFLRTQNKSNESLPPSKIQFHWSEVGLNFFLFLNSLFTVLKNGESTDGIKVIKGREFFLDLLKLANDKRYKVFILGSTKKILEKSKNYINKYYPAVRIKTYHGARLDINSVPMTDKDIRHDKKSLRLINRFQPDMLFVGYGAPKQEKWVYRNLDQLKCKLVMVVGGSFDYIAGTRKPVPLIIERFGMEWFWRLLTGSQKLDRIYNAAIKFPYLVLIES